MLTNCTRCGHQTANGSRRCNQCQTAVDKFLDFLVRNTEEDELVPPTRNGNDK